MADEGVVKVREPLQPGTHVDVVLEDPPVEHYRNGRGWGGKREGAGKKPRDPQGRIRVQKSITIGAEVHEAIVAAQQPGETYSETIDRLIRAATSEDNIAIKK